MTERIKKALKTVVVEVYKAFVQILIGVALLVISKYI